jgi:hypothetical protein
MALSWDYDDAERLVARLSPPVSPKDAERVLKRVFNGFARELYRERHESQPAKQVKKELEALQRALSSLSPRTANVLRAELKKGPFMPYPYHRGRLVIDPCFPGVPSWPWLPNEGLPGEVLLRMMRLAIERALKDMPQLRAGHPGKLSDATRRALHVLCLVYSRCHGIPYPTWDFFAEDVRNPAGLDFSFDCLRAWRTPEIEGLQPKDVVRSLHNYSGQNRTE